MGLADYNVEALLIEQIKSYLAKPNSYDDLRLICLNLAPIQSIIETISTKIRYAAEAEKMQVTIKTQNTRHAIDQHCNQMIRQAEYDCYFLFIKQLESALDNLPLNHGEKNALNDILASMNQYLDDVADSKQNDYLLYERETTLHKSRKEYADKYNLTQTLETKSQHLMDEQLVLNAELNALQDVYNKHAQTRNDYAGYSLMETSATALSSYFLIQMGIAATMPVLSITLASSAGAIALALLSTSIYSGIKSWYNYAELQNKLRAIKINQNELDNANETIQRIKDHELPALLDLHRQLENDITCQINACEQIRHKTILTYEQATTIQIKAPLSRPVSPMFFSGTVSPDTISYDELSQDDDLNDVLCELGIF